MGLPRTRPAYMSRNGPKAGASSPYGHMDPPRVSGAPPWAARTGVPVIFKGSARPGELVPWEREAAGAAPMGLSSLRRTWLREIALRRSAWRALGRTWSGVVGGLGVWLSETRRPEPTPLDSAPSRPHPLLGSLAHLLGAWILSECVACTFGAIRCPFAMTGRGPCRAPNGHMTRHLQTRRNVSRSCRRYGTLLRASRVSARSAGCPVAKAAVGDENLIDVASVSQTI